MQPLILASASPRRRRLLQEAGVHFSAIPSDAPEDIHPGEAPEAYALRVAREKAWKVARQHPDHWILGADTIVEIDGQILGKPRDAADGARMLRLLSGRTHRVMTAFVLLDGVGQMRASQVVTSHVTFKTLSEDQIRDYLSTGEPTDKAGAYAIQGIGAALVERVKGSYTNVVGLPVEEVLTALRAVGALPSEHTQHV